MNDDGRTLEEEIECLEKEIKDIKINNTKKSIVKNLKISKKALQMVAPYALTAGIIAGTFKVVGIGFPIYMDTIKKTADIKSEFDANGSIIKSEKTYDSYENVEESRINRLVVYSKWTKTNNNNYEREVLSYRLNKGDLSYLTYQGNIENLDIEKILGKPYMTQIETRNYNNLEDINGCIKIIVFNKDKNDYIMLKETITENIGKSFLYIIMLLLSSLGIIVYRESISKFNYNQEVASIKSHYFKNDTIELEEELNNKKKELKK